jgi:CubicO group peptidase (beta-lactamase class C family)
VKKHQSENPRWIGWLCAAAIASLWLMVPAGNPAHAQSSPAVKGDYVGTLAGALALKLRITAAPDGTLSGTLDSPNQGAFGIPCTEFRVEGQTLSFKVPSVNGSWKGTIGKNGDSLTGTWTQGQSLPLEFTRDAFVPAKTASPIDGIWLGTSQVQGQTVRTQLIVKSNEQGQQSCTVDSPDMNLFELACANVAWASPELSFEVPVAQGRWRGKLSGDGNSLKGTWTPPSGPPTELNFARQAQRIRPAAPPPVTFDPAIDPASAAGLEAVLRKDLQKTFSTGLLKAGSPAGVAIGVVRKGERRIFTFGAAKNDSIFEIGSITKTFTGLLLAQMIEQKQVREDTPVRELLPEGTVAKPAGAEITLLDLVTQHSGLPRLPANMKPADPANPYADYGVEDLYQFIGTHGVQKPEKPSFLYSNLGLGFLGQALANRANTTYPELLKRLVLDPLGLRDTTIALSAEQQHRFIPGYNVALQPMHAWDIDSLAGAGAIRSTAGDMLRYLEANLHPRAMSAAMARSHELRADAGPGMRIAYAWLHDTASGNYWHNGGTGGYTSYALFNPPGDYAVIVLTNVAISGRGSFADQLGEHISQRLSGKPAISLANW